MKPTIVPAGVLCFLLAAMPNLLASAEDQIDNALNVSKAWVAQIDAGQYDESYEAGCDEMHDKVPQDRWEKVLKTIRSIYGPVLSRTQVSHVYKPNGYEGTEGEFLIVTYDTSFKNLNSATEVVVLKWQDGKWRGAGYNAGPKSSPDDTTAPPPDVTTEIQTETNVKPEPTP
jgi:hypothetical protein